MVSLDFFYDDLFKNVKKFNQFMCVSKINKFIWVEIKDTSLLIVFEKLQCFFNQFVNNFLALLLCKINFLDFLMLIFQILVVS